MMDQEGIKEESFSKEKKQITTVLSVVILFLFLFVLGFMFPPGHPVPAEVRIESGQGASAIGQALKDKDVIRSKLAFRLYVLITGKSDDLKAGRYIFESHLSMPRVASMIARGLSIPDDTVISIPEGMNIWDIDEKLVTMNLITPGEFSGRAYSFEGYLFPDTYRISKEKKGVALVDDLIFKMRSRFDAVIEPMLVGVPNKEEVIIRASILEKEARRDADMKIVAGIIENRLEIDMLLQIDATVAYGYCVKSGFKYPCNVTQTNLVREIKIDGPYNSYTRKGLPAGPISNPGESSVKAILSPTKNNYLFYLSTRDGSQMIYSRTAGEHVANRRKYLGI